MATIQSHATSPCPHVPVPSPLSGMETKGFKECLFASYNLSVPSPPCGMETSLWKGAPLRTCIPPSPPRGMATAELQKPFCLSSWLCSKPTVWDGDSLCMRPPYLSQQSRSKPTAWDGDSTSACLSSFSRLRFCSEPTEWDGDLSSNTL